MRTTALRARPRRPGLARRFARALFRALRVFMLAFAGLAPMPPPPPPPPQATEQHDEAALPVDPT